VDSEALRDLPWTLLKIPTPYVLPVDPRMITNHNYKVFSDCTNVDSGVDRVSAAQQVGDGPGRSFT